MIRFALLLLASLTLVAADQPAGRSFLMLGGLTQIVDGSGKAIWKYPAATRDGYVLPNGNLLLTLSKNKAYPGGAVVEVTRDQKIVWEYKGTQSEVNTAVLLANGNIMLTEAGDKPRLLEVARDGSIKVEIPLGCQVTNHHMQSRMARPLPNGHYLVPQDKTVREYDAAGKVVWERKNPESALDNRSFCCLRNAAGHTLISLTVGNHIIEVDAEGKIVWELRDGDLPGVPVNRTTALSWLPNGNIVFSNYAARAPQPKLVEITREKKVVWTYVDGTKEGVHEFQLLDEAGKPLTGVLR
ncbi:MAG: PQQ-binding-like beta-propeller repeat protein [Opitutales bacterium]